jgi:ubiquilin
MATTQLKIKLMSGEDFFVNVDLNASVLDAKAAVKTSQNYDAETMLKLICDGKVLPEDKTLAECGITSTSFLVAFAKKSRKKKKVSASSSTTSSSATTTSSSPSSAAASVMHPQTQTQTPQTTEATAAAAPPPAAVLPSTATATNGEPFAAMFQSIGLNSAMPTATNPTTSPTTSPLGGMFGLGGGGIGGMGGANLQDMQAQLRQNPEMMREMMRNPMVQSMMENMMNDPNGMMQQMSNNVSLLYSLLLSPPPLVSLIFFRCSCPPHSYSSRSVPVFSVC